MLNTQQQQSGTLLPVKKQRPALPHQLCALTESRKIPLA